MNDISRASDGSSDNHLAFTTEPKRFELEEVTADFHRDSSFSTGQGYQHVKGWPSPWQRILPFFPLLRGSELEEAFWTSISTQITGQICGSSFSGAPPPLTAGPGHDFRLMGPSARNLSVALLFFSLLHSPLKSSLCRKVPG